MIEAPPPESAPPRFAAFISPHGFGHAARASAVMSALHDRNGAEFEVFSEVPRWFLDESIAGLYRYHEVQCDVGFRQKSALVFDLESTVRALDSFVPFDDELVERMANTVRMSGCRAALCDISPFGIAVAERAGIPSVLLENFSWGWLYEPLFDRAPPLRRLSAELEEWSAQATVHLQTEPVCQRDESVELVPPISRAPKLDRDRARAALGLDALQPVVVLTMGGYGEAMPFLDELLALDEVSFLVTGAPETKTTGNLRLFDNDTPLYMPNLLRAADAAVAKLGYGIIAEVWHEGLPLAQVTRPDSREMPPLEAFAARELSGFLVQPEEFTTGAWIERLPELLALPRRARQPTGGARRVAEVLEALS